MYPSKVSRCVLTDSVALLSVLLISLVVNSWLHVPAAISIIQIFAVALLAQAYPISTLTHDKASHKSRPATHIKLDIIMFGVLAGMVSYASFLLLFVINNLSPVYIETSHPLYIRATTLTYLTLILCQVTNLVFIRADEQPHIATKHLWSSNTLLKAYGISFFVTLNVIYNPLLQPLFGTGSLKIIDWFTAVFCLSLYVGLRRLHRHTRKHSRHAVVKLHRELHSKNRVVH